MRLKRARTGQRWTGVERVEMRVVAHRGEGGAWHIRWNARGTSQREWAGIAETVAWDARRGWRRVMRTNVDRG